MEDEELQTALEFIAKCILKPEVPHEIAVVEMVRLQAIAAKLHMRGSYLAHVEKGDRARKNLYFSAASEIDKLVAVLKYYVK